VRARLILAALLGFLLANRCFGQELTPPQQATAGNPISIATNGSGSATFYLFGPGSAVKQDVHLGQSVDVRGEDVAAAGRYTALLCSDTCRSANFFVAAGVPASMSFLAHPSRAMVKQNDSISGVVFPFDKFQNLILSPVTVNFQMTANKNSLFSRAVPTRQGVAWFRTNSGNTAGLALLSASVNGISTQRALQLVASDPCNLRIKAQQTSKGVLVETDPIHDCAGNIVPDGTIVTFTANSGAGRSTVDAPIKQGVARANLTPSGSTVISAASGVVMGNELRMDVRR
jgi:hypothetical protein